ncbi:MAG: phrB [Chlorobi bacterium]|nr:phrB [Chlorobiota bacterium]
MHYQRSICWLRRDLRLGDHAALAAACASSREVVVIFIFDTTILERLDNRDDRRVTFIARSLAELERKLHARGSALIVRHGDPRVEVPRLASELAAEALFANSDYEPAAIERDAEVSERLEEIGCDFHSCRDQVIYQAGEILTGGGTPYRVYTPFRNAWMRRLESGDDPIHPLIDHAPDLSRLARAEPLAPFHWAWDLKRIGFRESRLWLEPGEDAARRRLDGFMPRVAEYASLRDYPALDGTSGLSVHLRFGTISIRDLVRRTLADGSGGAVVWLGELIWREFCQMLLASFPRVITGAFREEYAGIVWPGSDEHLAAWRDGRTGYPIVDAAMRHFNATGWMHNRLRMIVASFLTKDLLVDYRRGEEYFARYLLDFDLASNNGNWQWAASTGCDAQPYFRIFNPTSQSRKFDADGTFIRNICPELAGFSGRQIHEPALTTPREQLAAGCVIGRDYPAPIVDHGTQRVLALDLFRSM